MQIPGYISTRRLRRGDLGSIEQDEFIDVIIALVYASGGKARRQVVLEQVHQVLGSQFKEPDYELLQSQNPPKERWIHNVDWAKRKLVARGFLLSPAGSPYGTWVLTEKGKKGAEALQEKG